MGHAPRTRNRSHRRRAWGVPISALALASAVLIVPPSAAGEPASLEWGPPILIDSPPSWRTHVATGAAGFVSVAPAASEPGTETFETTIRWSKDGLAWNTGVVTLEGVQLQAAVGHDAGFVAVGQKSAGPTESAPAVWTSQNGRVWLEATSVENPTSGATVSLPTTADVPTRTGSWMNSVVKTESGFLAVGAQSSTGIPAPAVWTSSNGTEWVAASHPSGQEAAELTRIASGEQGLVTLARSPTDADEPGLMTLWWSADGTSWSEATDGLPSWPGTFVTDVTSLGSRGFVMVGFRGMLGEAPTAWTSQDGLSWTSTALPIDADTDSSFSHDVAYDGSLIVVVGDEVVFDDGFGPATSMAAIWVSEDGTTWTRVPPESLRSDETVAGLRADTVYRAGTRWVVFGTADSPSENVQSVVWLGKDPALPRFDDVPGDHLFAEDVEWLAEQEITRGCNPPFNTRFCPDLDVTRGQMAAFLVRALQYTDNGGGDLFTDDDTSIFEDDIDKLAAAGVTKGCNPPLNTKYCPDLDVTRGQMAAFLHRATGD